MFLHTALIICREAQTEDQLKEIMATQPWAGACIHGFRNVTSHWEDLDQWRQRCSYGSECLPDSIYIDGGFGPTHCTWLDCWFHDPDPLWLPKLPYSPVSDSQWETRWKARSAAEDAWWQATVALVLVELSNDCHCYSIYYGQIEDEYEPGAPERAWKELILANCNYDPKVVAEFEATAA
jgi:hypothetical protein